MKIFILLLLCLYPVLGVAERKEPEWKQVVPGYEFTWPRDHGSHPAYETEWWYFTGHLGKDFGFELTFFRVSRDPYILIGHFALTDAINKKFYHTEILSRELKGVAHASTETMDVLLRSWSARMAGDEILISTKAGEIELSLKLSPAKNLILHGEKGVSIKGPGHGQASLYSSFTRLVGTASLKIGSKSFKIPNAQVWFDHEVTSGELFEEFEGWDWFALQLDDGTDIMLYQLRDKNGNKTKFSSGTYVKPDGSYYRLSHDDFKIISLDHWKSPKTGSIYPVKWKLLLHNEELELNIEPVMKEQEMVTLGTTGRNYWEGKSVVTGSKIGQAYVELTGY